MSKPLCTGHTPKHPFTLTVSSFGFDMKGKINTLLTFKAHQWDKLCCVFFLFWPRGRCLQSDRSCSAPSVHQICPFPVLVKQGRVWHVVDKGEVREFHAEIQRGLLSQLLLFFFPQGQLKLRTDDTKSIYLAQTSSFIYSLRGNNGTYTS